MSHHRNFIDVLWEFPDYRCRPPRQIDMHLRLLDAFLVTYSLNRETTKPLDVCQHRFPLVVSNGGYTLWKWHKHGTRGGAEISLPQVLKPQNRRHLFGA